MDQSGEEAAERERLIFGAGFAFGVMFTMLILAVVVSAVVRDPVTIGTLLTSTVLLPIVSAIALAAVVGFGLYYLALPDRGLGFREARLFEEPDDPEMAE